MSRKYKSFTLIELIIATGIFSVVMVSMSIFFNSVISDYIQAIRQNSTQAEIRNVLASISQDVQSGAIVGYHTAGVLTGIAIDVPGRNVNDANCKAGIVTGCVRYVLSGSSIYVYNAVATTGMAITSNKLNVSSFELRNSWNITNSSATTPHKVTIAISAYNTASQNTTTFSSQATVSQGLTTTEYQGNNIF